MKKLNKKKTLRRKKWKENIAEMRKRKSETREMKRSEFKIEEGHEGIAE